ncbi:DUF241 domain-containing protein, partial [Cephalotus follicularis]
VASCETKRAKTTKMAQRYHGRSISLPSRSHPSTIKIEQELNKLKIWEASSTSTSAGSICSGLSGLVELYICIDELLNLASVQQVLSQNQPQKYVDDFLDGSLKLLDICGITRDIMLQIKENVQALQSALRRRKGDVSIERSMTSYTCFRKKMKKDVKKLITGLNHMDTKLMAPQLLDLDGHISAVIHVLREVNATSISIFQSLLLFLLAPVAKPKQSRWSLVSTLMHKGAIACKEQHDSQNDLDNVDFALRKYVISEGSDAVKTQDARKRLEALEISIEGLESSLECLFRRLIKTRTSFLNIISQ